MCGIAGIIRFDQPATASRDALAAMRARLRHRGPDGEAEAFASFAALAHTRLAMVDPEGGAQPFRSADGRYLLVYNGELYNDALLRAELPGPWRTRSDTETLLAAWAHWGEACLERLDGMFAFVLWDEARQVGFAARDRLGVKPLAYSTAAGFAFASEAKALLPLLPGAPRANLDAIIEYLVAPAFSGVARSPFAGIEYLPPGHVLRVDRDRCSLRPYWRWSPRSEPATGPATEPDAAARAVRQALEQAVRSALRSDAPLGVFSSGGLDSTAVAAIARPMMDALPAFTIVFAGQDRWNAAHSALVVSNDTPFARAAADQLDLAAHEVAFDRAGLAHELAALARVNDALPAWEQELSQRTLARAAAGHVKGVLVGDAADETHFGYHFLLDDVATSGPAAIMARLGSVPVSAELDPAPVARLDAEYRALVAESGRSFDSRRERILATTQLIVQRWLPRLLHNGDIHCMASGLEARVPFAAAPLLELAQEIDPALGLNHGVEKWLLREAVRGLVPEPIRTRRKSALPKDQDVADIYRQEARRIVRDPHPLVSAAVALPALAPLLTDRPPTEPMTEIERAQLFRVISLHHWAMTYEVAAP